VVASTYLTQLRMYLKISGGQLTDVVPPTWMLGARGLTFPLGLEFRPVIWNVIAIYNKYYHDGKQWDKISGTCSTKRS